MIDMIGLLLFWNMLSLLFMGTEGIIMQIMVVVLYGGLIIISFMLYSNGSGNLVLASVLVLFSQMVYVSDCAVLFFVSIIVLLCVMV